MSAWKDVVGWEGLYRVSDDGQIKSVINGRVRILAHKNNKTKSGHVSPYVSLSFNGEVTNFRVDKLVAEAFLGRPANPTKVIHIDGDKRNCAASNLKWHAEIKDTALIPSLLGSYRDKVVSIRRGGYEDREARKRAMGHAMIYEFFMDDLRAVQGEMKIKDDLLFRAYEVLQENDPVCSCELLDAIGANINIDRGNGDE